MNVQVKLFARAREIAGSGTLEVELPESARVGDLRAALSEQVPGLRPLLSGLLVAVGTDYADDDTPLRADSEVACFPAVSGG